MDAFDRIQSFSLRNDVFDHQFETFCKTRVVIDCYSKDTGKN